MVDASDSQRPTLAADAAGGIHLAWCRKDGGLWYAKWNGTAWTLEQLGLGGYNTQPALVVDQQSNQVSMIWRRNRGFALWDVFFATRQASAATWAQVAKLYEGDNLSGTTLGIDGTGTLHVAWTDTIGDANATGGNDVWYTYRTPQGAWLSPPINISHDALFNANPDAAGAPRGTSGHVVYETWYSPGVGYDVRVEHVQIGTAGPLPLKTEPMVEGGAARTNKTMLTVAFATTQGDPAEVRFHWGAAPTDADAWLPFSPTLQVPVAAGVSVDGCTPATLYTQTRQADVTEDARSTTITVDTVKPTMSAGRVTVDGDTTAIIRTLTVADITVQDTCGAPAANAATRSRTSDATWRIVVANGKPGQAVNPNDPALVWSPIDAGGATTALSTTAAWSVFSGLGLGPRLDAPGTYPIYLRVQDAAGNQSAATLTTQAELSPGYHVPTMYLPLTRQ